MSKLKFKIIYVPIMLVLLCGALMIGLTDYVTAGFSLSTLEKASFWTNIICTNCGIACIIIAILLIKIDKFKEDDLNYKSIKGKIFDYHQSENFKSFFFKAYCFENNRKSKKITYLEKLHKKYSKLKPSAKSLNIYMNGTEEQKCKNRYCKRVRKLELLMSDAYVETNIDKLRIKYNTITESLVFSGVPTNSYEQEYITKHKGVKVLNDLLPKYLLTFAITCITAALSIELKEGITISVIINTASKLFSICSQIYFAYNYANKYNQEVVLHDIEFRNNIIKDYELWYVAKLNKAKEIKEEIK